METGMGLTLIIFLVIFNGLCTHPLNDEESGDYVPIILTPDCPLGFTFDPLNNNCRTEWNVAGPSNGNENLQVLCAKGLDFDEQSKTCVAKIGPSFVISAPIVCESGWDKDQNGNNSPPTKCVFGYDITLSDGECHLTKTIAGKVDPSSTKLFVICPLGYIYPGSGKLCRKPGRRFMIAAPVVCSSGASPDRNGKCRDFFSK